MHADSDLKERVRQSRKLEEVLEKNEALLNPEDPPSALEKAFESVAASWLVPVIVLAVTVSYVFFELRWNLRLIATVASGTMNPAELQAIVDAGRWLAAVGISWALLKTGFLRGTTPTDRIVALVALGLMTFGLHKGLGVAYEKAVDSLSPATAVQAYQLAAHRALAAQGGAGDALKEAAENPVATAFWSVFLADPAMQSSISESYAKQKEAISSGAVAQARDLYRQLEAQRAKHMGGMQFEQAVKLFDEAYATYIAASKRIEGIRLGQQRAIEHMRGATGGLTPNSRATKEEFAVMASQSSMLDLQLAGKAYLALNKPASLPGFDGKDPVVFDQHGVQIRLSEVAGKTEPEFRQLIVDRFGLIAEDYFPSEATVKSNPKANTVVSAALLLPVALSISLLAAIVNLGNLFGILLHRTAIGIKASWIFPCGALGLALAFAGSSVPAPMGPAIDSLPAPLEFLIPRLMWLQEQAIVIFWRIL